MLQALATTYWASVNGTKDQWRGPTGGTKHLAEKLKDEETGAEQQREEMEEREKKWRKKKKKGTMQKRDEICRPKMSVNQVEKKIKRCAAPGQWCTSLTPFLLHGTAGF